MVIDCTKRLTFLAEKFNVFTKDDVDSLKIRINKNDFIDNENYKESYKFIHGESSVIGIVKTLNIKKVYHKNHPDFERIHKIVIDNPTPLVSVTDSTIISTKIKTDYWVSEEVFEKVAKADPTPNLVYTQWMLNVFVRYVKNNDEQHARQFVEEDLDNASDLLTLFDENKLTKNFLNHCKKSAILNGVGDYSDIYQYKFLAQVYGAVDPFIVRSTSLLEKKINKFVAGGQAKIDYRDKKWMVYIPLTTEASEIFASFASWCTARKDNGMFEQYTRKNLDSFGNYSTLYIIINVKMFEDVKEGESPYIECYQLHCETKQLKNASNGSNVDIYNKVINEGIGEYFKEKLLPLAKAWKGSTEKNVYVEYLLDFGYSEAIFEMMDKEEPCLTFNNRRIINLPDLKDFRLTYLVLIETGLESMHPSIFNQTNLLSLALPKNKITEIPDGIQTLKKLAVFNLEGNPIKDISDSISELDTSRGGSLQRIIVSDIGVNINKLKRLLPNVEILEK